MNAPKIRRVFNELSKFAFSAGRGANQDKHLQTAGDKFIVSIL